LNGAPKGFRNAVLDSAGSPAERPRRRRRSVENGKTTDTPYTDGDLAELIDASSRTIQIHQIHGHCLNSVRKGVQGELQPPSHKVAKFVRGLNRTRSNRQFHFLVLLLI
jgi:hypothetical protein